MVKKKKGKRLLGYRKWVAEQSPVNKPVSAGRSIGEFIERMGFTERVDEQSAIVCWGKVVGEKIASVGDPKSIKDGILKVKVKDPVWRQELFYLKDEIRKKLNNELGKNVVSDIIFS